MSKKQRRLNFRRKLDACSGAEQAKAAIHEKLNQADLHPRKRKDLIKQLTQQEAWCRLYEETLIIPVNRLSLRGARYDVCLRERPLRAVHAMQTMMTRMVLFTCQWCRERFPTFHPAFEPPKWLRNTMQILKKGRNGVAGCDTEVASWEDAPPFPEGDGEEDVMARECTGVCLRCHRDMERQQAVNPDYNPVPKFSYLNDADPNYQFPEKYLELFQMATTTEAMLVSLEHMQVHYTTVSRSGLSKFRRNVISFPQDVAGIARRLRLLEGYRVGDRVNSTRGPGENRDRERKHVSTATKEEKQQRATDEAGYLIFPATAEG